MIYLIIIEEDLSSVSAGITQTNVLVWVFLNWFGILIETFALQIYRKRLSRMSGKFSTENVSVQESNISFKQFSNGSFKIL